MNKRYHLRNGFYWLYSKTLDNPIMVFYRKSRMDKYDRERYERACGHPVKFDNTIIIIGEQGDWHRCDDGNTYLTIRQFFHDYPDAKLIPVEPTK